MCFEEFLAVKCEDLPWRSHLWTAYALDDEVMIHTYECMKDRQDWVIKAHLSIAAKALIDVHIPSYFAEIAG